MPSHYDMQRMMREGGLGLSPRLGREDVEAGALGTVRLPRTDGQDMHEQAAADPRFAQAQNIVDMFKTAERSQQRRPRRQRDERKLVKLLSKAQQGFGTAPAGQSVAWGSIPEQTRDKLDPVMGEEPTVGWSLADLDKEDLGTLRRLMGRKGWDKWLRVQRAALDDPGWSPGRG